ncbi:hypothetical protein PoB_000595200 [Plakobranchus ocellatus]|uniref:Secreted protein n=1 Tax=Plakobranchus ocellatus TaxID=259542 RepID=A0AAV3YBG3_9GAST|nr:hypothetical protein PoB_000595200 [Plakobranchus ocellatus]
MFSPSLILLRFLFPATRAVRCSVFGETRKSAEEICFSRPGLPSDGFNPESIMTGTNWTNVPRGEKRNLNRILRILLSFERIHSHPRGVKKKHFLVQGRSPPGHGTSTRHPRFALRISLHSLNRPVLLAAAGATEGPTQVTGACHI